MDSNNRKSAAPLTVVIAFATVYIVWGSTYFFIKMAVGGIPPLLLGGLRFLIAGIFLLAGCAIRGERLLVKRDIWHSAVSGSLLLVVGLGAVIWAEQTLPSAMVAIMVSSPPIWFVLLDKPNWRTNFKSKSTMLGLVLGFIGVFLLFNDQIQALFSPSTGSSKWPGMLLLIVGTLGWTLGSLYSKQFKPQGSVAVSTAWQMIVAGAVFTPLSLLHHEIHNFNWHAVSFQCWFALSYLILFGSIAAFSAYVWLLQVRPATQVGTYAYVSPVIAVILGVLAGQESITFYQVGGLVVILGSVLLINLNKYIKGKHLNAKMLFRISRQSAASV